MADNFTQGTVAPFLPLLPRHHLVISMINSLCGDLPGGVEPYPEGGAGAVVTDQEAFDTWAAEYAADAGEELALAKAGLCRIMAEDGDLTGVLSTDSETVPGPSGERRYYLFVEDTVGGWMLPFLKWVMESMPEDVRFISFEYASTCSRMLPGEFGGGAWFIHRDGVEYFNTDTWIGKMDALFAQARRRAARSFPHGLAVLHDEAVMDHVAYAQYVQENLERIPHGWIPICLPEFVESEERQTYEGPTDLMSYLSGKGTRYSPGPEKSSLGLTETKNLLARAAAFMEDNGSISDRERADLLEDLVCAVEALEGDGR